MSRRNIKRDPAAVSDCLHRSLPYHPSKLHLRPTGNRRCESEDMPHPKDRGETSHGRGWGRRMTQPVRLGSHRVAPDRVEALLPPATRHSPAGTTPSDLAPPRRAPHTRPTLSNPPGRRVSARNHPITEHARHHETIPASRVQVLASPSGPNLFSASLAHEPGHPSAIPRLDSY